METPKYFDHSWMKDIRQSRGLTLDQAARYCDISVILLDMIESGWTTLPGVAVQIARAYGLTTDELQSITCRDTLLRHELESHSDIHEYNRYMNELEKLQGKRPSALMDGTPPRQERKTIASKPPVDPRHYGKMFDKNQREFHEYVAPELKPSSKPTDIIADCSKGCGNYADKMGAYYNAALVPGDDMYMIYKYYNNGTRRAMGAYGKFITERDAVDTLKIKARKNGWKLM